MNFTVFYSPNHIFLTCSGKNITMLLKANMCSLKYGQHLYLHLHAFK